MKRWIPVFLALFVSVSTRAQITVGTADMPVSGDTLRASLASPVLAGIDIVTTGPNTTWDFSALTPIAQSIDTFKTASNIGITYALTYNGAVGYHLPDTFLNFISGGLPFAVSDIYQFHQTRNSPSRFVLRGFGANLNGFPLPISYSDEDEWYFLPLQYGNDDTSTFKLDFSFSGNGIKQDGTRHTVVDGHGTIVTPFFTTPKDCIRVRSVADEIDSVITTTASFGIPRITVDYKWMVNGEHYPALWVTTNEIAGQEVISQVRYRDRYRQIANGISTTRGGTHQLKAYPVPATGEAVTIDVPAQWKHFTVELFDAGGRLVRHAINARTLSLSGLSEGMYLARVISGSETGYVSITR